MHPIPRLQRAIDFVESHLGDDFTLDDVAAAAAWSRYHLHRVFSAAFGDTLMGYIRKRRLTEAAYQLRTSDRRIIDLSLEAGFGSQQAFTRAFQSLFGASPGRYRRSPAHRTRPGLLRVDAEVLRHRLAGISHEPRMVEQIDPFVVLGRGIGIDYEYDAPVIALWQDLLPKVDDADVPLFGLTRGAHSAVPRRPEQCLVYIAGAEAPLWGKTGLEVPVPAGLYAVFEHRGPVERIVDTVRYAWVSWLPRSGYRKSERPDLERFTRGQIMAAQPSLQLWVSVDP